MLVIFSDLHLSDGTTATDVDPAAFRVVGAEIAANCKRPNVESVHVILLGDIFDLVRTDYWHQETKAGRLGVQDRPWNGTGDPATAMNVLTTVEQQFADILARVLGSASSQALVGMIRSLSSVTSLPVKVTYIIGNHDRVLHNYPSLQASIKASFAPVQVEFATSIHDGDYQLLARHGHEWDDNCHGWKFHNEVLQRANPAGQFDPASYRVLAIGEVVTAELMAGLIFNTAELLGPTDQAGVDFVARLKDVNNLRPMLKVFDWLNWFAGEELEEYSGALHEALSRSLTGVIESRLGKQWDRLKHHVVPATGDLIDHLEDIRRYILGTNFKGFQQRIAFLGGVFGNDDSQNDDYLRGAVRDIASNGKDCQYILYGHTHMAKHAYLNGSLEGGGQIYVNTGTYLPLITEALDKRTFASAKQLTMVFGFTAREGGGSGTPESRASLDVWDGIRRTPHS